MPNGNRMFDHLISALIHKYDSSFSALLPFLVQDPSAISSSSAIISCSSLGGIVIFGRASPFGTRACTAIVNECNQIIQATHRIHSPKRIKKTKIIRVLYDFKNGGGGNLRIYKTTIYTKLFFFKY